MISSCTGELGLGEASQHAARPNLPSRNNFTHDQTYISILHTPPLVRRRIGKKAKACAPISRSRRESALVRGVMVGPPYLSKPYSISTVPSFKPAFGSKTVRVLNVRVMPANFPVPPVMLPTVVAVDFRDPSEFCEL